MEDSVREQYEYLLSMNQMNLTDLDRDRLEHLCHGLLEGQIRIIQAFAQETKQSNVITKQRDMIAGLTKAVSSANAALANVNGDESKEHLLLLAATVMSLWDSDSEQCVKQVMTGIYRGIERFSIDPELRSWWKAALSKGFVIDNYDDDEQDIQAAIDASTEEPVPHEEVREELGLSTEEEELDVEDERAGEEEAD